MHFIIMIHAACTFLSVIYQLFQSINNVTVHQFEENEFSAL